ncbi:MAG: 2-dehydro-3-deoxy-6-phosphogalactonate aldolase [Comamonas sp.]
MSESSAARLSGLIAILRGIRPDESVAVGQALYGAGLRIIEVPLNSPQPFDSIALLRQALPADCLVGGGTVMSPADVQRLRDAGAGLVVMPHGDAAVIRAAVAAGLQCAPGVATPTEAFAALAAGAHGLKLFPAEQLPPAVLKAWRAVLPREVPLLPVGGITPQTLAAYLDAGAQGFGLGSALYKPGMPVAEVAVAAQAFQAAWLAWHGHR